MSKILFVVHKYYPYPGGSEYYVRNMAEEVLRRGHEVWVYAEGNMGDQNGVRVTSDASILHTNFDLIVVHGDCSSQNVVLGNIPRISSPVLYMLIKPAYNIFVRLGLQNSRYISYSTTIDKMFIESNGGGNRMIYVPHGIPSDYIGVQGFKKKYGIVGKMILSCGGFWQHKGHVELADVFEKCGCDGTLVLTGYYNDLSGRPRDSEKVRTILIDDYKEILSAISEADLYIMNSREEGFGLVLLESMLNRTPWAARPVGGAMQMSEHGMVYNSQDELRDILLGKKEYPDTEKAYTFVTSNHLISNTVDHILKVLE